jgi:short-subunit dehydrogenase
MGKMALITGASEGIGKVFAIRLAKSGYQVTAVARRENKLKELIQTLGAGHQVLAADLSTSEGQNLVAKKLEMNKYDILVNNAGVGTVGAFTQVPLEKQMAMIRLNCEALVVLSHAFLKNAKEGDSLLNVSSTLAFLPMPMTGLYCATKAFVTSLSESL